MLFSSNLSPADLGRWCRALRHGLGAGLSPVRVLRQQAKGGPPAGRAVAAALADRLERGSSLEDALAESPGRFPVLFLQLVAVGERTGRLTETFAELERHYDEAVATRRQFASALVYPAFNYVMGAGVVALLVLVLGLLGQPSPFGRRVSGPAGAAAVVAVGVLLAAAAVVVALIARDNEAVRGRLEAVALRVPGLGGCFRAFALHRFCLALHMTGEAGLRMDKALRLAFRAAANDAYGAVAEPAAAVVKKGHPVHEALAPHRGRLFPDEFLDAIQVGEVSGQLPEAMARQARYYREEAARQMRVLARIASGVVYAGVALLLIVMILRIATASVGAAYQDAFNAVDDPQKWLRGGR